MTTSPYVDFLFWSNDRLISQGEEANSGGLGCAKVGL